MLRNYLLSALAAATLAGCVTDYTYRDGNGGDYYYGQPRTEYRYHGSYDYFGGFGYGGYAPEYYYDRYGRLVYVNPYGYYGYPYGAGSWWYRPRPRPNHGGHDDDGDDSHDGDRPDRRPPWRDLGGLTPPGERIAPDGDDDARPRARRLRMPSPMPTMPGPQREQRSIAPPVPRMRSDDGGGSRMGRAIRNAKGGSSGDE
jgi:hypothetical protein